MRFFVQTLFTLAIVAAVGSKSFAGEKDAAELAARIDRLLDARLEAEKVKPAETADDAEFMRRAYLDLHGVVPTTEQSAQFLAETEPNKRTRLIDALLSNSRYGEYLGDIWQGYLVSPLADDYRGRTEKFRAWLAGRFNTKTWDQIATEILTATGKLDENPAVSYLIEGRLPRTVPDLTDLATRYFMGVRLNCAQCHDHPFVKIPQNDFWGMAAFFTQVQTPGKPKLVYNVGVKDYPEIDLAALKKIGDVDGIIVRPPTFLGGEELKNSKQPHRGALAAWLTAPKNPYFARAMANRTWWRLFGRGIVKPVDDLHAGNSPSHPELLDLLAGQFIESGFDLKYLTKAIVLTKAYQRTSRPGAEADKQAALFGRMSVKVLSAGQLYDSFVAVFGTAARTKGVDPRLSPRFEFVQFFSDEGDPDPTAYRRGIPHLLRQMNSGQFATQNIAALVAKSATRGRSADDVAGELFLAILSRRPTSDEMQMFRQHAEKAGSLDAAGRELAWALMMTSEFSLNH